jgi:hypothetical protein
MARHVSSSTLNERIQAQGYPSEVAALAETFNGMLERLEESFARLSRFSADIAHELRTPVNNIRGESEVALARTRTVEEYRDALGSCLEESVRLTELIESLLFLARAESPGGHLKRCEENIGALLKDLKQRGMLEDTCGGLRPRSHGAVDRCCSARSATYFQPWPTPRGGTITERQVRTAACKRIGDSGTGIAAEALPKVTGLPGDPARARFRAARGWAGDRTAIWRYTAVTCSCQRTGARHDGFDSLRHWRPSHSCMKSDTEGHAKMKSLYENAAAAALGWMMLMAGCGGGTEETLVIYHHGSSGDRGGAEVLRPLGRQVLREKGDALPNMRKVTDLGSLAIWSTRTTTRLFRGDVPEVRRFWILRDEMTIAYAANSNSRKVNADNWFRSCIGRT